MKLLDGHTKNQIVSFIKKEVTIIFYHVLYHFFIMKHSVKLFAIVFMAFPFLSSCIFVNQKPVYGNHQLVNQQIKIEDYESIVLKIPGEVNYQQFSDSTPYFQIHTDENIFNALDVRVEGNQLIIEAKKDSLLKPSQLTVYTCSHNLNRAGLYGSGEIRLKGEVNAKKFELNIFGSGNLLADSLLCEKMEANIFGSGNAQLTGACVNSSFKIAGSGSVQGFNFLVQELNCEIIGSGNVETLVTKKLDANIKGSGNLSYRGDPESINKKVMGSGKVISAN